MPLSIGYRENFDTLMRAASAGDAAPLECQLAATGEPVAVICAANRQREGDVEFVPLAMLFSDDPCKTVLPPLPSGGFATPEEVSDV
jgi:hypothetical protein